MIKFLRLPLTIAVPEFLATRLVLAILTERKIKKLNLHILVSTHCFLRHVLKIAV